MNIHELASAMAVDTRVASALNWLLRPIWIFSVIYLFANQMSDSIPLHTQDLVTSDTRG